MWRCISCRERFTKDHGQLTWHSQQSQAVWNTVIEKTIAGDSIADTAAEVDVRPNTALHMRHKILKALEDAEEAEPVHLRDQAELDEKYVQYSHKGFCMEKFWLSANFCDNLMRLFDTHVTSVNDLQEEVIII